MQLIPVIDVLNGQAVHARRGQRYAYQPLRSALTPSARPEALLEALLKLYPFPLFYLADLDALTGRVDHGETLIALAGRFPAQHFWLDAGFKTYPDLPANITPILATESWPSSGLPGDKRFVLSLDSQGDQALDKQGLFGQPEQWPETLILMNLALVGSEQGPDLMRLGRYRQAFPEHRWVASGGVRGRDDLQALADLGVEQALVATALYSGQLGLAELNALAQT
ncbi:MAG: HisA/HisF-related TIM barrel protein [Methylococcales bacterium]|nr:HisA/HisF-related TIM barrel protein [Methylococcales bacterium]